MFCTCLKKIKNKLLSGRFLFFVVQAVFLLLFTKTNLILRFLRQTLPYLLRVILILILAWRVFIQCVHLASCSYTWIPFIINSQLYNLEVGSWSSFITRFSSKQWRHRKFRIVVTRLSRHVISGLSTNCLIKLFPVFFQYFRNKNLSSAVTYLLISLPVVFHLLFNFDIIVYVWSQDRNE